MMLASEFKRQRIKPKTQKIFSIKNANFEQTKHKTKRANKL